MSWVWSDELADTLRKSPEFATVIPESWSSRPAAFALRPDETLLGAARRLLGIDQPLDSDVTSCPCVAAATSRV